MHIFRGLNVIKMFTVVQTGLNIFLWDTIVLRDVLLWFRQLRVCQKISHMKNVTLAYSSLLPHIHWGSLTWPLYPINCLYFRYGFTEIIQNSFLQIPVLNVCICNVFHHSLLISLLSLKSKVITVWPWPLCVAYKNSPRQFLSTWVT